jgi:hypothetical protein
MGVVPARLDHRRPHSQRALGSVPVIAALTGDGQARPCALSHEAAIDLHLTKPLKSAIRLHTGNGLRDVVGGLQVAPRRWSRGWDLPMRSAIGHHAPLLAAMTTLLS